MVKKFNVDLKTKSSISDLAKVSKCSVECRFKDSSVFVSDYQGSSHQRKPPQPVLPTNIVDALSIFDR